MAVQQQQDLSQYARIFSLTIPAGIKRDGTVFQTEQYTDGVWCRFQRGDPKKMGGYKTLFQSFGGIFRGMINIPDNGVNYVFAGTANTLDVFTTGLTFGSGSGPYVANMLPGTTYADVVSNTTTNVVVAGDVTSIFGAGDVVFFNTQTMSPTNFTIVSSSYSSPNTTIVFTGPLASGLTRIFLNNTPIFSTSDTNNWQFDSQFSPFGGRLNLIAHPGKNLLNIDSGVVSQVLVGSVAPGIDNSYFFVGLSDSEGQTPTYEPIEVDGGVCVLYPFLFAYGSNGYISNNHVSGVYGEQTLFDWNGPLANQVNVSSSKVVKGMPMRGGTNSPSGLFWATDSLIRVSFNSAGAAAGTIPSTYWNYDIVSSQISIMSSSAVVEMDGIFFWMGIDRFYLYNGTVKVLPNDKNINWLFNNLNYTQRQKVWATKVPRYNEIWFFYPRGSATECTDAIIYNVKDQLWYDAGSAEGARRSCGYTTELFPTPIWAGWDYDVQYSNSLVILGDVPEYATPAADEIYFEGDVSNILSPGSNFVLDSDTSVPQIVYTVESSIVVFDSIYGLLGMTIVTATSNFLTSTDTGVFASRINGGYTIWQHEFGVNKVTEYGELAVYSSITTSDISWLTGNPSEESRIGTNRRMHLRRFEPNFLQTGTMSMTILGRRFASGTFEETSGPFYFTQDTGKIDLRVENRLMRLQFVSNEVNGNYEMGRNLITAEYGDERP
jgi:hypothetical protein